MTPTDIPTLHERLNELAEALGAKQIGTKGLAVWTQTLREFSLPDVVDVLTGWAKRSAKMPAPMDVWKQLNDQRSEALEQKAKAERVQFDREASHTMRRDPLFAKKLRALVSEMRTPVQHDPKDWARLIYARYVTGQLWRNGDQITQYQIESACTALRESLPDANAKRDAALANRQQAA